MSNFFRNFPTVDYRLDKGTETIKITNIMKRFRPLKDVMKDKYIFFDYNIQEGERAETVAHKLYDNVDYHWVITMFNEYLDPYFSWPLFYQEFEKYLEEKYGSVEQSTQIVYQYQWIIQHKQILYDGTLVPERMLVVDEATFYGIDEEADRRIVYCYDYEVEKNDAKRQIKILDASYLRQLMKEKESIFG